MDPACTSTQNMLHSEYFFNLKELDNIEFYYPVEEAKTWKKCYRTNTRKYIMGLRSDDMSLTIGHRFSGKQGTAYQAHRGLLYDISYQTTDLIQDSRVYYEAFCLAEPWDLINMADYVEPWFIRAVFEGTEDECLLWKLSQGENWQAYSSIEELKSNTRKID